jgi:hypothetical protein
MQKTQKAQQTAFACRAFILFLLRRFATHFKAVAAPSIAQIGVLFEVITAAAFAVRQNTSYKFDDK